MNFWKFNIKILWIYLIVLLVLTTILILYSSKIAVFEDLEIYSTNTNNTELVFITPLNKQIRISQDINKHWEISNIYAQKICLISQNDSFIDNNIKLIVNGKEISINKNHFTKINDEILLEIPYKTKNIFSKKIFYIIESNLPFENKYNNLLLIITSTLLIVLALLTVALKKESKKYLLQRIKKNLSIRQIKSEFFKPYFQISLFALLWLILIILTIR